MDHSIKTLTPARIATIPPREMHELLENRTPIALALIRTQLVDEATLLPADQIDRIFEPFFTSKASAKVRALVSVRSLASPSSQTVKLS